MGVCASVFFVVGSSPSSCCPSRHTCPYPSPYSNPLPLLVALAPSAACCLALGLHLCGNQTMSTMQHKSDNAVALSDCQSAGAAKRGFWGGGTVASAALVAGSALLCCCWLFCFLSLFYMCHTKIAHFADGISHSQSRFTLFSRCGKTPQPPHCYPFSQLFHVVFLCPQFALPALSTSFALLLFPRAAA